jgi:hypothetical protein
MVAHGQSGLAYLEAVESFFLARRGRGLMLSPADAHLVRDLQEAGVPAEVVCRAVARAFEVRDRPPRSLRACAGFIEAEVALWRAKEVGRNAWDPEVERRRVERQLAALLGRIEAAGRRARDDVARELHRRAWRGVRDLLESVRKRSDAHPRVARVLADLESRLLADALAALSPAEAQVLRERAWARVALRRQGASDRAFAASLQAAAEAEVQSALGLVPLVLED